MAIDYTMYDFMDKEDVERFFDDLIEEKLFELKLKYK